ncbi:MAG: hypothetical protein NUV75_01825 [Gallionella sp.]|nr:hypothetical protein [Gallionella sp.]
MTDWWNDLLAEHAADGRCDADLGVYRPPWASEADDPQNQDENVAYRRGFDARRRELGEAFKWA